MSNITIFIPTYRRPHLLKRAIESALNQSYSNIQVIVCDNASDDETADVVKKYPRVKYICHPQNIGMLQNYSYCLSVVETEFFSFLSDDDILLASFCKTALDGFEQFPDIAFYACSTTIVSNEKGVLRAPLDHWHREGRFPAPEGAIEMIGKYPVPMTVLFRSTAASIATIDFHNSIAWDCDFLIQIASKFPIAISKQQAGIFFSHCSSHSGNQPTFATLQSIDRLKERVNAYTWMEKSTRESIQERFIDDHRKIALRSILSQAVNGQAQDAWKEAQSLRHPFKIRNCFFCFRSRQLLWCRKSD